MEKLDGLIIKGIGGFYYVETSAKVYECKARGIFRKSKQKPLVGDRVSICIPKDGFPYIDLIYERKNSIVRPQIANIDQLAIVSSACAPSPNIFIIDKMISLACYKNIEPILILSKSDLSNLSEIKKIYDLAGIKNISVSSITFDGIDEVEELLYRKITAFIGNSGVGKSTLLNCIFPNLNLEIGDFSHKLGRGKHTTRNVELFKCCGGYVADTPGFSTVDIERYEFIKKEQIQFCFKEFEPYIGLCKFTSCSHMKEKGCKIIDAVEKEIISKSRYSSYVMMYNEVKDIKEWKMK